MLFGGPGLVKALASLIVLSMGAALLAEPAFARGGHGGFRASVRAGPAHVAPRGHFGHFAPRTRVFIGTTIVAAPLFYSYVPRPAYVPVPVIAGPYPPAQYIEQPAPTQESANQYWYYCSASQAYYPYVRECPGGWQQVMPSPPPS